MKNRAKCKKCETVIESFHATDLVLCKCGAIGVDGGDAMKCLANDWSDFVRVDDEGNEVIPQIDIGSSEKNDVKPIYITEKPTKKELLDMLEAQINSIENLPRNALYSYVSQSDLASSLMLLLAILRSD